MTDKILTISIAAYNSEKYIKKCLDSFTKTKEFDKLDIIVVNDGSTDNTKEIVEEYVNKYTTSIRLINKNNGGHGSTINVGIKNAAGKYFKIVDADDWVDSENLDRLISFLEKTDVDLLLNPFYIIEASNYRIERIEKPYNDSMTLHKVCSLEKLANLDVNIHALTTKTENLKNINKNIDENCYYVDLEYVVYQLNECDTCILLDYPIYNYLLGTGNQSMTIKNIVKRRNEHKNVIEKIIAHYNWCKKNNQKNLNLIKRRITFGLYNHYKIYFCMEAKNSFGEFKQFDKWLKSECPDVYEGNNSKLMKVVRISRLFNYILYKPISDFLHIIKYFPNKA